MTHPEGLPPEVVAFRRTPVFDQDAIPAGLRREHRTKPGVWALIAILEGKLRFRTLHPASETVLSSGSSTVVGPEQPHEVDPEGPVRFFVEFYRAAEQSGTNDAASEPVQTATLEHE